MIIRLTLILIITLLTTNACVGEIPEKPSASTSQSSPMGQAEVLSVSVTGESQAYQFAVKVASPDMGCEQYADWWEVLDTTGTLLYRRVLLHSHVDEQPFTRSGGPVPITADQTVIVRAHMTPHGYGKTAMQGSVEAGFSPIDLEPTFSAQVETEAPLPDSCAW